MRRRYGLAFEDQALPESEEDKHIKHSVDLLRVQELELPDRSSSDTRSTDNNTRSTAITVPSNDTPVPLLSPPLPDFDRSRKTQSAYNPITTAGLWDSGVTERPGLKARPTSMFVMNEKKKKQERKRGRSKSKEDEKDGASSVGKRGEWNKFKTSLKGLFRRDRSRV
jgi:hypothetical protein